MKRALIITTTLISVALILGAIGPYPRYIEELRIGGGRNEPVDGGADFDKQGAIDTDGWINTAQQYRVDGNQIALSDLADAGSIPSLAADETVSGAWTFTTPITNTYNATSPGYTQSARDMLIGTGATEGRYSADQTAVVRAGAGGGDHNVVIQPSGAGATEINNSSGTGGVTVGNGAGTNVATIDGAGNAAFSGDVTAKSGALSAGVAATARGVITANCGAGGAAPGCLKLISRDGTVWYIFVRDDGAVRVADAMPTSNNDGVLIGSQF